MPDPRPVLFVRTLQHGGTEVSRPINFYVGLTKLGKVAVTRSILEHGGHVSDHPGTERSNTMCLVDADAKARANRRTAYSVDYIQSCINARRLLDPAPFRIVPVPTPGRKVLTARTVSAEKLASPGKARAKGPREGHVAKASLRRSPRSAGRSADNPLVPNSRKAQVPIPDRPRVPSSDKPKPSSPATAKAPSPSEVKDPGPNNAQAQSPVKVRGLSLGKEKAQSPDKMVRPIRTKPKDQANPNQAGDPSPIKQETGVNPVDISSRRQDYEKSKLKLNSAAQVAPAQGRDGQGKSPTAPSKYRSRLVNQSPKLQSAPDERENKSPRAFPASGEIRAHSETLPAEKQSAKPLKSVRPPGMPAGQDSELPDTPIFTGQESSQTRPLSTKNPIVGERRGSSRHASPRNTDGSSDADSDGLDPPQARSAPKRGIKEPCGPSETQIHLENGTPNARKVVNTTAEEVAPEIPPVTPWSGAEEKDLLEFYADAQKTYEKKDRDLSSLDKLPFWQRMEKHGFLPGRRSAMECFDRIVKLKTMRITKRKRSTRTSHLKKQSNSEPDSVGIAVSREDGDPEKPPRMTHRRDVSAGSSSPRSSGRGSREVPIRKRRKAEEKEPTVVRIVKSLARKTGASQRRAFRTLRDQRGDLKKTLSMLRGD